MDVTQVLAATTVDRDTGLGARFVWVPTFSEGAQEERDDVAALLERLEIGSRRAVPAPGLVLVGRGFGNWPLGRRFSQMNAQRGFELFDASRIRQIGSRRFASFTTGRSPNLNG
jgi:hypothetical protein